MVAMSSYMTCRRWHSEQAASPQPFTVFQLKHADIKTVDHQLKFNLYWFQSFKSMDDLESYIKNVDGLTFEKK